MAKIFIECNDVEARNIEGIENQIEGLEKAIKKLKDTVEILKENHKKESRNRS